MDYLTDEMLLPATNNHFEVRHHNIITTARYDYSACQIDIMFYMLSLLRPYDTHETIYKLHVRDGVCRTFRVEVPRFACKTL